LKERQTSNINAGEDTLNGSWDGSFQNELKKKQGIPSTIDSPYTNIVVGTVV